MEIFGLHKREFFLHLDFIKTYLNIDSANIYTTLIAPFSPTHHRYWLALIQISVFSPAQNSPYGVWRVIFFKY